MTMQCSRFNIYSTLVGLIIIESFLNLAMSIKSFKAVVLKINESSEIGFKIAQISWSLKVVKFRAQLVRQSNPFKNTHCLVWHVT